MSRQIDVWRFRTRVCAWGRGGDSGERAGRRERRGETQRD